MGKGKVTSQGGKSLLGRLQQVQQELTRAQAELANETVEASAGGGAVKVIMSGAQECRAVLVEPRLLAEGDVEMLQDLLKLAVNQAVRDAQSLAARRLGPLAGGGWGGGGR